MGLEGTQQLHTWGPLSNHEPKVTLGSHSRFWERIGKLHAYVPHRGIYSISLGA